ncbi:MAG: DUF4349 domain-containing protein, partial [Oscillospiraceae bacterium]|nr:DUF4349 domain-containing protein [Oscillospiraceae bacterium]
MKNKRMFSLLSAAALCVAMFTSCSAATTNESANSDNFLMQQSAGASYEDYADDSDTYEAAYGYNTGVYTNSEEAENSDSVTGGGAKADSPDKAEDIILKEMLVYSCNMTVDTLEFDEALAGFKAALNGCGGFVETENYSDGGSSGRWYKEGEEKWKSYTATVRVPSGSYEEFVNIAGNLGDLRSKTSSVENLSREYSDLSTTLEIYLAKEERYIARLSEITDEEYALKVERELTDIQIQIANIRNRMSTIRTDVAYSYVYISLNEVKEYVSEPVKTDTFGDRLSITLETAGSGFLRFLEELLFVIIYAAPYLIFSGVIVLIIVLIVKGIYKRYKAKAVVLGNAARAAGIGSFAGAPKASPVNPPVYTVPSNNYSGNNAPENNSPKNNHNPEKSDKGADNADKDSK